MSQFAAPDNLHIYPILIDKPNAKNQSVFPSTDGRRIQKSLGGLSNLFPVFSLSQDRQLRWRATSLHKVCSASIFRQKMDNFVASYLPIFR